MNHLLDRALGHATFQFFCFVSIIPPSAEISDNKSNPAPISSFHKIVPFVQRVDGTLNI